MTEISSRNFGLLIAYLIPGLVVVWGASYFSETVRSWLTVIPERAPTIAGFLYLTMASAAAGVTISAVRWAVLDTVHHLTGVPLPKWNFAEYPAKREAFDAIVEDHYRFYQFYGNMFCAVAFLYVAHQLSFGDMSPESPRWLWGLLGAEVILFAGSRDALKKYYVRGTCLLGEIPAKKEKRKQKNLRGAASRLHSRPARFRNSDNEIR